MSVASQSVQFCHCHAPNTGLCPAFLSLYHTKDYTALLSDSKLLFIKDKLEKITKEIMVKTQEGADYLE